VSEVSTDWSKEDILSAAKTLRLSLIEKMKARSEQLKKQRIPVSDDLLLVEREALPGRISKIGDGDMLELSNYEGRFIIEDLVDQGLIDRNRGLLLYSFKNGRISCVESDIMPRSTEAVEPPYTFSLWQDVHFNAMIEDGDVKKRT
jgi:hypothetical protein